MVFIGTVFVAIAYLWDQLLTCTGNAANWLKCSNVIRAVKVTCKHVKEIVANKNINTINNFNNNMTKRQNWIIQFFNL